MQLADCYRLLELLQPLVLNVGDQVATIYHANNYTVQAKIDQSPVTCADLLSHRLIVDTLTTATPWPVLSEESAPVSFAERQQWASYWLVDPLDGTKEFVNRTGEFTVNIALIHQHRVVLGIIGVPLQRTLYYAATGFGAFKQDTSGCQSLQVRTAPVTAKTVVMSRRHGLSAKSKLLAQLDNVDLLTAGSSLKLCLIAEGRADFYPRLGPTSEWDTAAGQCIVEQAGGAVVTQHYQPLQYNAESSLLNPAFFVIGDTSFAWAPILKTL